MRVVYESSLKVPAGSLIMACTGGASPGLLPPPPPALAARPDSRTPPTVITAPTHASVSMGAGVRPTICPQCPHTHVNPCMCVCVSGCTHSSASVRGGRPIVCLKLHSHS
eukprot:GHVU01023259.1.p2 GENE.GHVU01023259.1~~GHVU01023259.1.p2  ORF type:complete len:110 (+),score=1.55 GHVU01023259.1:270-599(+)